jgi:hypothetical protein
MITNRRSKQGIRKPLYLVMGKVIQQRHIAAMVLGKFIHKGRDYHIFIVTTIKIKMGRGKEGKELEERKRKALLFCVSERDVPAVNLPALYLIVVMGS